MKTILKPTHILIFIIIFILIFIFVNYIAENVLQLDKYSYEKTRKIFNFFCFIPGTIIFLGISIYNFSISKKKKDKRNIRISLIPICLITLFYIYTFIMLLYVIFIRDIG